MEHRVVFCSGAVRLFEQPPDGIEKVDREAAVVVRIVRAAGHRVPYMLPYTE